MAKVLSSIEEDDDGTTEVPGRRKRRVEDEPEHLSIIPEDVEHNPMAPVKRRKKNQIQPSQVPPLPLEPAHPAQIPPRPDSQCRPQFGASTQLVPLPTDTQSCSSRSAPQHQPQSPRSQPHAQSARRRDQTATPQSPRSQPHAQFARRQDQTATPQSSRSHHQQLHDEAVAAFGIQAGLDNDDSMDAFDRDDANMADVEDIAVDDDEDGHFPQESQLQSDDIYATPPLRRRLRRKHVYDSDFDANDQSHQPESPRLRSEGCIIYSTS